MKPVAKVIAEIRAIKQIWSQPFIEFADDNTFVNKAHSKTLMRALASEGMRWFTETDIAVADDDELLRLMREAGCAQILIGLESPLVAGLDGLEHRRNWKRQQLDRYRSAIERIQSHGIAVNGCFVLGLDGHTPAVFDAVEQFAADSGLHDVQITVMTAFPGTPLYERLRREGRLLDEQAWEKCTLFDVNFQPEGMTADELGKRADGARPSALLGRSEAAAPPLLPRAASRRAFTVSAAEPRRGRRCRSAAIELSDDPRFAGRVRRLAFVSIAALGWLVVLWSRTAETLPLAGAALVAGWITMPLTLLASLQQPLIRYALVVPSTLVTGGVVAMLVRAPLGGVTAAGWTVILAGLALELYSAAGSGCGCYPFRVLSTTRSQPHASG